MANVYEHDIQHDPTYLKITSRLHLLHQIKSSNISMHGHFENEHFLFILLTWKIIVSNVVIITLYLRL